MELREYREREDIMAPKVIRASKDSMARRGYRGFRVIRVRMVLKAFRGTRELMAIHGTQVPVHRGRG